MEKEFIPYEQALALKELEFDESCFGYYSEKDFFIDLPSNIRYYTESIIAPTFSQVFRWFREKHTLYGTIRYGNNEFDKSIYLFPCINGIISGNDSFETQEEAELECLKKLIEIVKKK